MTLLLRLLVALVLAILVYVILGAVIDEPGDAAEVVPPIGALVAFVVVLFTPLNLRLPR